MVKRYKKRNVKNGETKGLNKKQKQQVRDIADAVPEEKFHIQQAYGTIITDSGAIVELFDPAQGITDQSRIGDTVTLRKMNVTMQIRGAEGNGVILADVYNSVRVIIFQWHPSSAIPTNLASILLNGPSGFPDVWSHYQVDNRQDFTILKDRLFTTVNNLDSTSITNYMSNHVYNFNMNVSLNKARKKVQFVAGGVTTKTNGIYMMLISDSSNLIAIHPEFHLSSKISYIDS